MVTVMPRSRQAARSVVSSPTPLIARISRFGRASSCARDSPAMPCEAAPRMRGPTAARAAMGSAASATRCTVNRSSSAATTKARWIPTSAISGRFCPAGSIIWAETKAVARLCAGPDEEILDPADVGKRRGWGHRNHATSVLESPHHSAARRWCQTHFLNRARSRPHRDPSRHRRGPGCGGRWRRP